MLWPFVAFGGYIFWISIAIFLFVMMIWSREDFLDAPFAFLAIFGILFLAFVDVPWSWFVHNYLLVAMGFAVYVIFGISWSFMKWLFFLHDRAKVYAIRKPDFEVSYKRAKENNTIRQDLSFAQYVLQNYEFPPQASEHKNQLMYWAFFWPISILKFMLYDFFRKTWDFIYSHLSSLYQRIANTVFAKFPELKD